MANAARGDLFGANARFCRNERRATPFSGAAATHGRDFPDPYVLRVGTAYLAYATQAGGNNIPVLRSGDRSTWEPVGDALPQVPAWAAPGWTWSPAVLPRGDGYVLYHAVREPVSGLQCIAAEGASAPEGPFQDLLGRPLVLQRELGGSIDPSVFVDAGGQAYLVWKSDGNAIRGVSFLWGQEVSADGLALVGEARMLLRHDRGWEQPLVEAPAVVAADGWYYLFYSAGWWESDRYCIGYAVGRAPLGPYVKVTRRRPWMVTGEEAAGPGGQEFFRDHDGALWMAYHAWTPGRAGYARGGARSLRISRIGFVDGRPVVQSPEARA